MPIRPEYFQRAKQQRTLDPETSAFFRGALTAMVLSISLWGVAWEAWKALRPVPFSSVVCGVMIALAPIIAATGLDLWCARRKRARVAARSNRGRGNADPS